MNAAKKKYLLLLILVAAVGIVLCVLFRPVSLLDIVSPSREANIERIIISEVELQSEPKTFTLDDSVACSNLSVCFGDVKARWRGLNPNRIVQENGTMYSVAIYYSSEASVKCTLFDGKFYCGKYSYTLSSDAEAVLAQCFSEAINGVQETTGE